MSGLQEFLAPFSHLLFANRNLVIVLLCFAVLWTAGRALLDRWRVDGLRRDLNAARSNASLASPGRRYPAASSMEEGAGDGGALPPVKGGRSYARNLGSALQKAGMSGPQIYSPPTPTGFAPNTTPMQPAMGQPGQPAPYAPNVPWAAPAGQPWAFQPGAGRNAPAPPPAPAPFYQPQPVAQPPTAPPQPAAAPVYPPTPTPGGFGAPQPGPFAQPVSTAPATGPAAAPPSYPTYVPPAAMPPGMMPPTMQPIAQPLPEAGDGGRRGKPKRRRFNFNVLENLEKMVQPRAPEAGMAPMQSMPPAPSAPITDSAATLPTAPAAPPVMPALTPQGATLTPPPVETPSLPFLFGKRGGAGAGAEAPASQPAEATVPPAEENAVAPETPVPPSEPAATFAPSSPPEAPSEPKVDARRSMRSMMFGEEIAAAPVTRAGVPDAGPGSQPEAAESTADFGAEPKDSGDFTDSTTAEPKADDATSAETETSWSSWSRSDQASSAIADESSSASEAPADAGADAEPSEERTSAFDAYEPWKPSTASEPAASSTTETESWRTSGDQATEAPAEPVTTEEVPVASAEPSEVSAPETPGTSSGGEAAGPSAGTLVIIEDDQTAASYYATLFRGNGYHVEVANDGVSGVDLCARVQPQVILLDVMMPRQNGILVLQTLRASDETKNTPVVVMSNFSEPTLIKRALQLGALEYVIKTQVEGPALLNAVPRWVNREKAFSPA